MIIRFCWPGVFVVKTPVRAVLSVLLIVPRHSESISLALPLLRGEGEMYAFVASFIFCVWVWDQYVYVLFSCSAFPMRKWSYQIANDFDRSSLKWHMQHSNSLAHHCVSSMDSRFVRCVFDHVARQHWPMSESPKMSEPIQLREWSVVKLPDSGTLLCLRERLFFSPVSLNFVASFYCMQWCRGEWEWEGDTTYDDYNTFLSLPRHSNLSCMYSCLKWSCRRHWSLALGLTSDVNPPFNMISPSLENLSTAVTS